MFKVREVVEEKESAPQPQLPELWVHQRVFAAGENSDMGCCSQEGTLLLSAVVAYPLLRPYSDSAISKISGVSRGLYFKPLTRAVAAQLAR